MTMPLKYSLLWLLLILCSTTKVQSEPPQTSTQSSLSRRSLQLCPCTVGNECNKSFYVPMLVGPQSYKWLVVASDSFVYSNEIVLRCKQQQVHLTLSEGSFALLPSGDLVHVHGKLVIPSSSFCFKRSYSDNYILQEGVRTQYVILEAEACITPPKVPQCCPEASEMIMEEATAKCKASNAPSSLSTPISFDGSLYKWSLEGEVQNFPVCNETLTFVPIGNAPGFGILQFVSEELQFRWQPNLSAMMTTVDKANYCVALTNSYMSYTPSVAFCRKPQNIENLCNSGSVCYGKCCPDEAIFDLDSKACETTTFLSTWKPGVKQKNYTVVHGLPSCLNFFAISEADQDEFRLLENGSLFIKSWQHSVSVPKYCIDLFRNMTHIMPAALVCFEDSQNLVNADPTSPTPYIVLLMLTSLQLLCAVIYFIVKTVTTNSNPIDFDAITENGEETNSDSETVARRRVDPFHLLVAIFFVCTALESFLLGLQHILFADICLTTCVFLARVFEVLSLAAVTHISALTAHQWLLLRYRGRSIPRSIAATLFAYPWVVAVLTITAAHFTAPFSYLTCPIDAAMTDPWSAFPITVCSALMLLATYAALLLGRRAVRLAQPRCTAQQAGVKDRWWLVLKLCSTSFMYQLSYVAVWEAGAIAFWVFADIAIVFKGILLSACLLRPFIKCQKVRPLHET